MKAVLIDTTKCIGCRACQVACKSWNDLPADTPTKFSDTWSNPRYLDADNYTRIIFREVSSPEGDLRWHFIKRQCNHCLVPACESACPVGALKKLPEGPVVCTLTGHGLKDPQVALRDVPELPVIAPSADALREWLGW